MTVPYLWTVYVQLRWQDGSIPTNQQISQVLAFESYGDTMQDLCGAAMEANGICTLHFGSEKFYPPRTNPTLTIKVFDCQGVLLHTQEFADVVNNSTLSIVINGTVNNNWRVSGTVKNSLGAPVTTGTVRAFDVYYSPERLIGQQIIGGTGRYNIEYTSDLFGKSETHPAPNLVLRAYDTSNAIIAEAARSNPSQDETVDLVVSGSSDQWRISGFVTHDGAPLTAGTVWLFDTFSGTEYPLGSAVLNGYGYYQITYLESQFQHGTPRTYPELTAKVYSDDGTLYGQFNVPSPPSNNQIFNIVISGTGETYTVSGTITNTINAPVQGVQIGLKSLSLVSGEFKETDITALPVTTDLQGNYTITYNPAVIPGYVHGNPISLFIVVTRTESSPAEFLGKSPLYTTTAYNTEINLMIDAPSNADTSLYTTIHNQLITAGVTDVLLLQMKNNETIIEYVARKIERTKEEVGQIVDAFAIMDELREFLAVHGGTATQVNETVLYALIRTGSIASFTGLKTITPQKMHSVLVAAIAQSIIPAQTTGIISTIDDEWKELYANLLSVPDEGAVDAKVLAMAGISNSAIEEIVRTTYAGNAHNLKSFQRELEENLTAGGFDPTPVISRLDLIFDVFRFADEFDLLANSIVNYLNANPSITHISGLTALEKDEWLNAIIMPIYLNENKGEEFPDEIPGETIDEKKNNYAKILFRKITGLFPMARFRHELTHATSSLWSQWEVIKTFLVAHPEFDFIDNIDTASVDETVLGLLQTVQRIFRLTPRFTTIDGLLSRGFTSAISIAHKNGDDFVKDNEDITDGVDDAQTIYTAAVHTASQALFLMGTFNQQTDFSDDSLPAVTEKLAPVPALRASPNALTAVAVHGAEEAPENGIKPVYPNIATLFGQQNQCLCPDCQSIFSPSAYMVDLFEFMGPQIAEILFSRRPDLAETELSCRNTNGPVAYIDLVNELLENAVCTRTFFIVDNDTNDFVNLLNQVLQPELSISSDVATQFGSRGLPLDKKYFVQHKAGENRWYIVGDGWRYLVTEVINESFPHRTFRIVPVPQTGKNAQLRRALPEHQHRNAYTVLKYLSFPYMMPFDLPFLETNRLLKMRNTSRYLLHHVLTERTEEFPLSEMGLRNFFEMTPEQYALMANPAHPRPWELWGLQQQVNNFSIPGTDITISGTHAWTYLLQNIAVFLHITGFTYDQLLDLLLTSSINGDGALFIAGSPTDPNARPDLETADLSKLWLQRSSTITRSYSEIFTTMARFIRLAKHTSCDTFLLDRVQMLTCNLVPLDNLQQFYKTMRVATEFGVSPYQVATWCTAKIDNVNLGRGPLCQLEELFISRIESGDRANRWKRLLNDNRVISIGRFDTGTEQDRQGGDIKVLLGGLKIKYDDLSLIAHYEFDPDGDPEIADARAIFDNDALDVQITLVNLGKMFRAADLSRHFGLSVKEYYILLTYMPVGSGTIYDTAVFYRMRDAVRKLKKFKISVDDLDYLLNQNGYESTVWAVTAEKEVETIIRLNSQCAALATMEPSVADQAREELLVTELSKVGGTGTELTRILLAEWLHKKDNSDISMLDAWVAMSTGGWNVTLYDNGGSVITTAYTVAPSIHIVSGSEVAYETIPDTTRSVQWTAHIFVNRDDQYEFIANQRFSDDVAGTPGGFEITIIDPETGDPLTPIDTTIFELLKDTLYAVTIVWQADVSATSQTIAAMNLDITWRGTADPDAKALPIGPANVLFSLAGGLERIVKSAFIVKKCAMTADQLSYIAANMTELGCIDFNDLPDRDTSGRVPWSDCAALFDIFQLNRELTFKRSTTSLFSLWQEPLKTGLSSSFIKIIANETGWPVDDIAAVASYFGFISADYRKPWSWKILNRVLPMLDRIGIAASFGYALYQPEIDENSSFVRCEALRNSVQTRYTTEEWAVAGEKMRESLRIAQRDALCVYLMSRRMMFSVTNPVQSGFEVAQLIRMLNYTLGTNLTGNSFTDQVLGAVNTLRMRHDLEGSVTVMDNETWDLLDGRVGYLNGAAIYARYLIDVDMGPEVMTTRIVQANCSIQLLMQRALLNMEKAITLNNKIIQQWPWMKNYRLWEANRKIFLYPENWLEPEFRDDKTPLFKEIESVLLQKELDDKNVEEAIKKYTAGLANVANLEIIGAFEEGKGSNDSILHVIGRTYFYPHQFFYRRNHRITGAKGYWTPWEQVDLDITSDVVVPVPFMNKLYLFWPMIELKESMKENENYKKNDKNSAKFDESMKFFELKLAWSEYQNGSWSSKRISVDTLMYSIDCIDNEMIKPEDLFHFKASIRNDRIEVDVFIYDKIVNEIVSVTRRIYQEVREFFLFKISKTKVVTTTQKRTEVIQKINRVAQFSFSFDGSSMLKYPIYDYMNYLKQPTIPDGVTMRHNRAEEATDPDTQTGIATALTYPKGNILFNKTIEDFKCFPTNLSFLDNAHRPLFYQEKEKSFIVKPVQMIDIFPNLADSLQNKNRLFHAIDNFYHPLSKELMKKANLGSLDDLMTRPTQANALFSPVGGYIMAGDTQSKDNGIRDFKMRYLPTDGVIGDMPLSVIDYSLDSAYGIYNWELFFHLPLFIGNRLSSEHRYQDAMRWFHFIFNPGNDFTEYEKAERWAWSLPKGARFWNFLPFFANRGVLATLYDAVKPDPLPGMDTKLGSLIEDWKNDPFKPHLIARVRVAAYQKSVVMKYLDNLINWGDDLFRLDNMESINEAINLYVYASEILGEKPKLLPSIHDNVGLTYTQMKSEGLDQFSNTFIQLENYIPPAPPLKVRLWRARGSHSNYYYYHYKYNYSYKQTVESVPQRSIQLLRMAPAMHYFCIPKNDRLLAYWTTVEDRLFKIRNSLNIDGIKRAIPLFAPPIDPGLLARAAAAGINIGSLLRDLQTAPSVYRYSLVFQKAVELCNELKSFGSELLAALEKRDAEHLSLLRSSHEITMYKLIGDIRKNAIKEAQQSLEGLKKQKDLVAIRYDYYKNIEQYNAFEKAQLATNYAAGVVHTVGQIMVLASAPINVIPDFTVGGMVGFGGGPIALSEVGGGEKTSGTINKVGNALIQSAGILDRVAGILGTHGSYKRRSDEWKLQESLAKKEGEQVDKQILAAEIRIALAELELRNHEKQIEQALEVREVMESKFTNEELYVWMSDQLSTLYNQLYNLAYGAAKRAERAYQFELGLRSSSFITPEMWNSAKKGLLAGDNLLVALRQMDNAFIENNKRELELTKTISLKMINPAEYLVLQESGRCTFSISESLFDFDFPGHYFRRIKSVTLTVPCVTGPFTTVNARLRLVSSSIRQNADLANGIYARSGETDDRFFNNPVLPATIATSSGQSDAGVFELNFRDERYLPFEGAGAVSQWELEFPGDFRQFDYASISDVIITINYTARESTSADFVEAVKEQCSNLLGAAGTLPNIVNVRQTFPVQFKTFVDDGAATISLDSRNLSYMVADYLRRNGIDDLDVEKVTAFVVLKKLSSDSETNFTMEINGAEADVLQIGSDERLWQCSFDTEDMDTSTLFGDWDISGTFDETVVIDNIYLCFNSSVEA